MASCFIDTNCWVYAFVPDQDLTKHRRFLEVLTEAGERGDTLVVSNQVLNELGHVLARKINAPEDHIRQIYKQLNELVTVCSTDVSVSIAASKLRETDTISYWDSLIIAASLESSCDQLWSEDLQHDRVFDDRLRIVNPLLSKEVR